MNPEQTNGHAELKEDLSGSDEWSTPQELFDALNAKYKFGFDLTASDLNHRCARYFTKEENALLQDWPTDCWNWGNFPYSKPHLDLFSDRTRQQVIERGCRVVTLTPNSTSEAWFQRNILGGMDCIGSQVIVNGLLAGYMIHMEGNHHRQDLLFLKGRKKFLHGDAKTTGAMKGSVVCAFWPKKTMGGSK